MRRFWFLAAALLLIWLDVFILTNKRYPIYEYNDNYGRQTQDFVDQEVVGEYMPVDVVSDLPGLVILLVLVLTGGPAVVPIRIQTGEDGKRRRVPEGKMTRLGKRDFRYDPIAVLFLDLSIAAIVIERLLPFWVNGVPRYAGEYLTRLADIFLPLIAVFFVLAEWIRRTDLRTTHRETDISGLLMMVSLFGGFLSRVAALYGFPAIRYTAWAFEGLLMMGALILHYISLQENARKILDPTPEPEESKFAEEPPFDFPR